MIAISDIIMEDPVCLLPVHELDAVVQVGHTGHAHGLGQPEHISGQYPGADIIC